MKNSVSLLLTLVFTFSVSVVYAHNKGIVIPLNLSKKMKNVVTVSASGGDFTDPVAAVNSITNATAENPYLVVIGPGTFPLGATLELKPFVTVTGSGRNVTILTKESNCIIFVRDDATLRDLTIEIKSNGNLEAIGICKHPMEAYSTTVFQNLNVKVSGGTSNVGVNIFQGQWTMINVAVTVSGGTSTTGIANTRGNITMNNVTVNATGGTSSNRGIVIVDADSQIINSNVKASGGTTNKALENDCFESSGLTTIKNSVLEGSTNAIKNVSAPGTVRVMQSSIIGGADNSGGGVLTCVHSDNGVATALNAACQ